MLALDCETTGVDLRHGSRPFFVSFCDEEGVNTYFEWSVDPKTRQVQADEKDFVVIQGMIDSADELILQNPKFDHAMLRELFTDYGRRLIWDWGKVRDTLLAGHLLASNQPHDLTTMALVYLKLNIKPLEDALEHAVNEARRRARAERPEWRIAEVDLPEMPSARGKVWRHDYWLPRQLAEELGYKEDHSWQSVLREYGNGDSTVLIPLYRAMHRILEQRGLTRIYEERLKLLPVVSHVEDAGVTLSSRRLRTLVNEYKKEAAAARRECVGLSGGLIQELPISGTSNALKQVVYGRFRLVSNKRTKKGNDSMDRSVLDHWLATLEENSHAYQFVAGLKSYRKRMTAVSYMTGYRKFWRPLNWTAEWYRLHPSLNPTGTDTLRWSSSNPNEQNISKQEGFNLRYCFGPAPGREWWSLDAQNIELRLPAYEAGETEMIALFERPDEPPYYGSNHLLVCNVLHPKLFAECEREGVSFKDKYKSTWYQWVKNGNFAVQYGAMEESGTADRAYHVEGAQRRIKSRFRKIARLNERMIKFAEEHGYVETIPDRTVDPRRGYPLLCTRSNYGRILPTVPLNYHVQGTAMWWMMKAMIRCHAYLQTLGPEYRMVMQVHDELVFDFPAGKGKKEPWKTNLPKIRRIQKLMAEGGEDIGVPTPVSVEYHAENWSEGISV